MDIENNKKDIANIFIDAASEEKIISAFEHINGEVSIRAVLQPDCKLSDKIRGFLGELTYITNRIPVSISLKGEEPGIEEKIGADILPVIALFDKDGEFSRVCYHGVPGGHELESFISAVTSIAGVSQIISEPLLERINRLQTPLNLKIGVSPTCIMCPELVQSCQSLAIASSGITSQMIDLNHFPDLVKRFKIMSIPVLIINDKDLIFGGKTLEELISKLE